jgi:hypothetical protein
MLQKQIRLPPAKYSVIIPLMFRRHIATRLIALFVTAFICLNAGGAVCVAYCQAFDIAAEQENHTPDGQSEHCDKSKVENDGPVLAAAGDHELDCCPMTVSFFAGPIEKKAFSVDADASMPASEAAYLASQPFVAVYRISPAYYYRGPPLDRRVERIKNRVFRI